MLGDVLGVPDTTRVNERKWLGSPVSRFGDWNVDGSGTDAICWLAPERG